MTAQDNLNGQQFYHGTPEELERGSMIVPGDDVGKRHMGSDSDSARVWVSTDPWRASKYGLHVYEVEPSSSPRSPHRNDEHYTASATVLREVPYEEALRTSRAYNAGKTRKPGRSLP